jgi:hypothetical protein
MTDPVESIEMSTKDEEDLKRLLDEGTPPEFHPVLEVWREVLAPAADLAEEKVTPQWASKMVATYPGLVFADMEDMQRRYFAKIGELAAILDTEIAKDKDCLTYRTPEDDALENSGHYKQLLTDWQLHFLQWELDWETTSPEAATELASISEVHKMFFGPTGLTAYLDNIKFEFNEEDQTELAQSLRALRDGEDGSGE